MTCSLLCQHSFVHHLIKGVLATLLLHIMLNELCCNTFIDQLIKDVLATVLLHILFSW